MTTFDTGMVEQPANSYLEAGTFAYLDPTITQEDVRPHSKRFVYVQVLGREMHGGMVLPEMNPRREAEPLADELLREKFAGYSFPRRRWSTEDERWDSGAIFAYSKGNYITDARRLVAFRDRWGGYPTRERRIPFDADGWVVLSQPEWRERPERWDAVSLPTCFEVLSLDASASVEDIKRRFRTIARLTHPDVGGDPVDFMVAQEAYEQALRLRGAA